MYEDKTLVCKECGSEFVFTAGEQEFYAEASRRSRRDAKHAVTQERTLPDLQESCSPPPVQSAEKKQRFRSSRRMTDRFTAASAMHR